MRPFEASETAQRREFLRRALRYAALTGCAGLAAAAVARRAPLTGPSCGGTGICGDCGKLLRCPETQAEAARAAQEKGEPS